MALSLRLPALLLSGVLAGIYVGVLIGDVRIADLDAGQYAALHQARDKTFRRVMPVLGVCTAAILAGAAARAGSPIQRNLFAAAALIEVLDIAIAIRWQVPRNNAVQAWAAASPPIDWRVIRDGWDATHKVRTALGLAIFLLTAAASES
ncbi:MAG: anthrone oxygenase family protein [Caulobacteraceae bacterium]